MLLFIIRYLSLWLLFIIYYVLLFLIHLLLLLLLLLCVIIYYLPIIIVIIVIIVVVIIVIIIITVIVVISFIIIIIIVYCCVLYYVIVIILINIKHSHDTTFSSNLANQRDRESWARSNLGEDGPATAWSLQLCADAAGRATWHQRVNPSVQKVGDS